MSKEAEYGITTEDILGEQWVATDDGSIEVEDEFEGDLVEVLRFTYDELEELGVRMARRYLAERGYALSDEVPGEGCDFIAYDCQTEVMVGVRVAVGEMDPLSVVAVRARERMKAATLARIARSDYNSVRYDAVGVAVKSASEAQIHHFLGVCEWEC